MPPSSIITILSLLALCTLSFTVVFGSRNILDTLTRDTLAHDSPFSLPKSNVVHKRRAIHHARATTAAPASGSNSPQSNPIPSQSAPSTPDANTQASSAAPVSSPSPSPSSQPSPTQDNSSSAPSPSRAASTSPGTSAASASASPLASSTPSPSAASSSSNAQASSSLGVIRSSVGVTSNVFNNPTTTFNNPVSYTSGQSGTRQTNAAGSTISSGATPSAGAASGFFGNKAAVGATFSIVGIVGGLAVIMAVLTVMKRRRRVRVAIEDEEFFEKYPSVDHTEPVPHIPPGFGTGSAEPSVTDFNMSAAPAGAYPDRAVHYGQSNAGAVLNPVDYGIAYPPGAANNNHSTPAIRNGNTYEDTESEYSVPSASHAPPASHPFADPANTSGPTAAPPVTYPRSIPGRVQEMVTTDSYYGPNSAGLGAGGVGYAE